MPLIDIIGFDGHPPAIQEEVEMAKGRKVRAGEAAELLNQWERSGEPLSMWCAARGLNWYSLSAFKGWMRTRANAAVTFAEVVVDDRPHAAPIGGRYRVEIGDVVVEVDDQFCEATLRRLLRVFAC